MKEKKINIGVVGLWHLGCVYSASLAKLGFNVSGFDENSTIINGLNKGIPPIEEPQLKETIKKHLGKKLLFSTDPKKAIAGKDYIFITYDIPVDDNDQIDLSIIDRTTSLLEKYLSPETTIVISSQLPVGTSRKLLEKLIKTNPTIKIIYFPENLRLGTAFESFLKPDRVVIGSQDREALESFEKVFSDLDTNFIKIGLESAEMVKHMLNSYLATMISFSSEISDLAELFGADMREVVAAVKTDRRVSVNAPLNPGLGFAGGTLGRDVQTLKKLSKKTNYTPLLLNSVYEVNQKRLDYLLKKIQIFFNDASKNKKIGILGLTYKPQTNTLRRSMSLELASLLKNKGFSIKAYDPAIKKTISGYTFVKIETSAQKFFQDLDLVVLMTEWPEFKELNWKKLAILMKSKKIIDCKNFLNQSVLKDLGFDYQGVGYK